MKHDKPRQWWCPASFRPSTGWRNRFQWTNQETEPFLTSRKPGINPILRVYQLICLYHYGKKYHWALNNLNTFVLSNTVWFIFIRCFEICAFTTYSMIFTSYILNSINILGYWDSERACLEASLVKSPWNWQLFELLEQSSKAAILYLIEI